MKGSSANGGSGEKCVLSDREVGVGDLGVEAACSG